MGSSDWNVTLSYAAFGLTCKLSLVYRTMSTSLAAAGVALVLVWVTGLVLPFSLILLLFPRTLHRQEQIFVSCYHFPLNQVHMHVCMLNRNFIDSLSNGLEHQHSLFKTSSIKFLFYCVLVQQITEVALLLFCVTGVLLFHLARRPSDQYLINYLRRCV